MDFLLVQNEKTLVKKFCYCQKENFMKYNNNCVFENFSHLKFDFVLKAKKGVQLMVRFMSEMVSRAAVIRNSVRCLLCVERVESLQRAESKSHSVEKSDLNYSSKTIS